MKENYFNSFYYLNEKSYIIENVKSNLEEAELVGKNVLDYGCGAGDYSVYFNENGAKHVVGIDISEKSISVAKKRADGIEGISFILSDLRNCDDLPNQYFDVIWSDTTIEYINKPLEEICSDFKKHIKPDGVLYLSFQQDCFFNRVIYFILFILKTFVPKTLRPLFYYVFVAKHMVNKILDRELTIDREQLKNKIHYLFVPFIRLVNEKYLSKILTQNGFEIQYIRKRIDSDKNSAPHLELKALFKPEETKSRP